MLFKKAHNEPLLETIVEVEMYEKSQSIYVRKLMMISGEIDDVLFCLSIKKILACM